MCLSLQQLLRSSAGFSPAIVCVCVLAMHKNSCVCFTQTSPRCASLALKHYLLKPVQRIPQYQLLLTGTKTSSSSSCSLLSILQLPAGQEFYSIMQLFYWQHDKEASSDARFYFVDFIGCCVFTAPKWRVKEAHPSIQQFLLTSFIYFSI